MFPVAHKVLAAATAAAAIFLLTACGGAPDSRPDTTDASTPPASIGPNQGGPAPSQETTATPAASTTSADDFGYVPESSIDTQDKRLNVTLNDETIYIRNGGQVVLRDGLAVEIYVDPYPPATLRTWLDFYLTKGGEPVTNASMGMDFDMLAMEHGPFWSEAENLGGGHYTFTLDYIMFGPWDQLVTIRYGLERIKLPVVLVAYP